MRLGHRLQQLINMIEHDYSIIWDTCCDHGLLGAELLNQNKQGKRPNLHTVYFVDIQADIMANTQQKLETFYPNVSSDSLPFASWQTLCSSVEDIQLVPTSSRQLIVIAGVGGDLMSHFVNILNNKFALTNVELLLCPVRHTHELRETLKQCNFGVISEKLIVENQRFYECLHVAKTSSELSTSPITIIGKQLWQSPNKDLQKGETTRQDKVRYCQQMIKHFKAASANPNQSGAAQALLTEYQIVLDKLHAQPQA